MQIVRVLAGALLWIVASVVGLVAVLLCVTLILLPLGIPLLAVSRRLFTQSIRLFMPRPAVHPLKASRKSSKKVAENARDHLSSVPTLDGGKAQKRLKKAWRKAIHA